jgi:molybdate transport system substrate-binding protein
MRTLCPIAILFLVGMPHGLAAEVSVAVAANFTAPMQKIARDFERESGHKAVLSFGSTGSLYAQIKNGAPYQVFLSADDKAPQKAEEDGLSERGARFTYAIGKLVLWSKKADFGDKKGEILKSGRFERIAIANPKLAPYGAAAEEVIQRMGLTEALKGKLVQGENITQTHQFIATENAALGFIALSQVYADGMIKEGSAWIVPASMHAPIRQDAVLLKTGKGQPAAEALIQYLKGKQAQAIIRSFGYELK